MGRKWGGGSTKNLQGRYGNWNRRLADKKNMIRQKSSPRSPQIINGWPLIWIVLRVCSCMSAFYLGGFSDQSCEKIVFEPCPFRSVINSLSLITFGLLWLWQAFPQFIYFHNFSKNSFHPRTAVLYTLKNKPIGGFTLDNLQGFCFVFMSSTVTTQAVLTTTRAIYCKGVIQILAAIFCPLVTCNNVPAVSFHIILINLQWNFQNLNDNLCFSKPCQGYMMLQTWLQ